jgi:hypothetical protein
LRRDTEKIRQLFGVIEPEKMRESSRHKHFEGDEVVLAKLVVKKREKPGKFGSLVIPGVHNSMIFGTNKTYPYKSNWILWNKCVTFNIP